MAFGELGKIDLFGTIFGLLFVLFVTSRRKNDFGPFIERAPFDAG
jgi:hypothetical protein